MFNFVTFQQLELGPALAHLRPCYFYFCPLRNWCNILGFFFDDIGDQNFQSFDVSWHRCRKTLTCWCSSGTTSLRSWMGEFYELVRRPFNMKRTSAPEQFIFWVNSWFLGLESLSLVSLSLSHSVSFFMQNDVYARYNEPNASPPSQNEFRACW